MNNAWTGPHARLRLAFAGLILLASVAVFTVFMRRAETVIGGKAAPQTETYTLLEVRPADAETKFFAAAAIEAARRVPHVVAVQRYVVGHVAAVNAPELQVIGVDVTVPLRVPGSDQARVPQLVKGRPFGPDDAERPVAIVGQEYAKVGKTVYGYEIAGMVDHGAPIRLDNAEVRAIGMFVTGDSAADSQVLLPLTTAERLFNLAGQAHGLYVQVDEPANVARVERELRAVLGESMTITRVMP